MPGEYVPAKRPMRFYRVGGGRLLVLARDGKTDYAATVTLGEFAGLIEDGRTFLQRIADEGDKGA